MQFHGLLLVLLQSLSLARSCIQYAIHSIHVTGIQDNWAVLSIGMEHNYYGKLIPPPPPSANRLELNHPLINPAYSPDFQGLK